ncbi:MAG TPA: translation elongation factor Ts [Rectinemataceae bacterium]|nr:translation elongation factor Ts [Rectinemataceae bacterium]
MNISIDRLKTLREKTGAGIMDCKRALLQTDQDLDAAESLINEWGLSVAQKRQERATNEGCVGLVADRGKAALASLACETDFVALNPSYIEAVRKITLEVFEKGLKASNETIDTLVADIARRMKENIALKGIAFIQAGEGDYIDSYLHGDAKTGVAIRIHADDKACFENPKVLGGLHDLSLQVAANNPSYIRREAIPLSIREDLERSIREEVENDAKYADKPEPLKAGIVAGKVKKFFSGACLYEQRFIRDEKTTIAQLIDSIQRDAGTRLYVVEFVRLAIAKEA